MSLVPCKPKVRVFATPGFTPGSLPVLLPIPDPIQSHSIALVQRDLLIVSMQTSLMVSLHLTLSLSPLIALLRWGLSDRFCDCIYLTSHKRYVMAAVGFVTLRTTLALGIITSLLVVVRRAGNRSVRNRTPMSSFKPTMISANTLCPP